MSGCFLVGLVFFKSTISLLFIHFDFLFYLVNVVVI